ncbi:MAG: adenine phosphoribosyltransferase [candidate division KSB1 bacterium]|nr:adenine phosphoribosyltransferase [candidate division KSB1 bacterium]
MEAKDLKAKIRSIPGFPKPGIVFRDITTLLQDPEAFRCAVDEMAAAFAHARPEVVVGVEARGFIFGSAIAYKLGAAFVPARKPGKLPAETIRAEYALEYGTDAIEIHRDAVRAGQRVLLVDDLLATGGTMAATASLVEQLGGQVVGIVFLIELGFLRGREKLARYPVVTLVQYASEEE